MATAKTENDKNAATSTKVKPEIPIPMIRTGKNINEAGLVILGMHAVCRLGDEKGKWRPDSRKCINYTCKNEA